MNEEELKKLKITKHKCLNDFLFFVRYMFKAEHNYKFTVNWHHKEISKILENMVYKGKHKRLVVNMPPRHSKTIMFHDYFVAWCYAINPKCNFIHVSSDKKLALKNSSHVKKIMSLKEYKELFDVEIARDFDAKEEWQTTEGGNYKATSSDSGILGYGAGSMSEDGKFGGALIIDDPNKMQKIVGLPQNVKAYFEKVNEVIDAAIDTRLNSKETPIICIQQRVGEGDLSGYLIEKGYEVVKFKFIDDEGNILWKGKFTDEQIESIKRKNTYKTQYQQEPVPLAGQRYINLSYFGRYKAIPEKFDRITLSLDTANKIQEQNDPTAILVIGRVENRHYILDAINKKLLYPDLKREIKNLISKWKPDEVLIEDKSSGMSLIPDLKQDRISTPIIACDPGNKNKVQRMSEQLGYVEAGLIYLPDDADFLYDLEEQFREFPFVKHDDLVDAFSQYLKRIKELEETFFVW